MKTRLALLVVWVALLLVACGPATSPPPTDEGISRLTPTPAPGEEATPGKGGEESKGLLLVYERSGGIAGVQQVYEIHADGRVVTKDDRQAASTTIQMDAASVKDLVMAIERAGFFDLKETYLPINKCCDRMTYRITVYRNGVGKSVTTMDGVENLPESLVQVQTALAAFLQKATPTQ
ncbi:MAG: hypothetical protein IT330_06800 [Anaerolineae bacterium]|nr:hypothetical protein [Anaerolineae bacterium]